MTPVDTRPASILNFERFYTLYLITTLLSSALLWDRQVQKLTAIYGSASAANGVYLAGTAVGLLIVVALWYFAARRGSVIARWLVLAQFALALAKVVWNAIDGRLALGGTGLITLVTLAVLGLATWFLFQPDARAWRPTKRSQDAAA